MSAYRTIADTTPTLTAEEEREFWLKCTSPASGPPDFRSVALACVCLASALVIEITVIVLTGL